MTMSIKINIFASSTTGLGGWAYKGGCTRTRVHTYNI